MNGSGIRFASALSAIIIAIIFAASCTASEPIVKRELLGKSKVPCLVCYMPGTKGAPVAIVQHWWEGKKEDMRGFGIDLAKNGILAVLPDARMHGERASAPNWNSDIFMIMKGTVQDISGILDSLAKDKRADTKRVGMMGISMGGLITHLAITQEKRITVAAPEAGTPDWTFIGSSFLPYDISRFISDNQPITHPERYRNVALLMLHGQEDYTVPGEGNRLLYDRLKPKYAKTPGMLVLKEFPGVGHPTTPEMNAEAVKWLVKHLKK